MSQLIECQWLVVGWTDAWIITGGTQTGVRQFVGQAVRDYMLQSGNYEQKLVVIGVAALGLIANSEAIRNGCVSKGTADSEVLYPLPYYLRQGGYVFDSVCSFVCEQDYSNTVLDEVS